ARRVDDDVVARRRERAEGLVDDARLLERATALQRDVAALEGAFASTHSRTPPHPEEAAQRPSRRVGHAHLDRRPSFETRAARAPQDEVVVVPTHDRSCARSRGWSGGSSWPRT